MCRLEDGDPRTFGLGLTGLLGQQDAGQHLLPGVRVLVRLEGEQGLGLVLRQPQGLELQRGQGQRQVGQPGGGGTQRDVVGLDSLRRWSELTRNRKVANSIPGSSWRGVPEQDA